MKKITSLIIHLDRNNHNHFGAHLSKPSAKMDTLTPEKKSVGARTTMEIDL